MKASTVKETFRLPLLPPDQGEIYMPSSTLVISLDLDKIYLNKTCSTLVYPAEKREIKQKVHWRVIRFNVTRIGKFLRVPVREPNDP